VKKKTELLGAALDHYIAAQMSPYQEQLNLLTTIPGVSYLTACVSASKGTIGAPTHQVPQCGTVGTPSHAHPI